MYRIAESLACKDRANGRGGSGGSKGTFFPKT